MIPSPLIAGILIASPAPIVFERVVFGGTATTAHQYAMIPSVVRVDRERLLVCYSRAAEHYDPEDETGVVCRHLVGAHAELGEERRVADTPSVADRGAALSVVGRRVYLAWIARWNIPPGVRPRPTTREIRWAHSDDAGDSWSQSYVVQATRTGSMLVAGLPRWEIWGGDCVATYYDQQWGDQCRRIRLVRAPIIDGVCATERATVTTAASGCRVNSGHYGDEYEEPSLCSSGASSRRSMIFRNDYTYPSWPSERMQDYRCYGIESDDDGRTWTPPLALFPCASISPCLTDANGVHVVEHRIPAAAPRDARGVFRVSLDGRTWGPPIEHQDPALGAQMYGAIIEQVPGGLGVVSAQEINATRSTVRYQVVTVGGLQ